MGWVSLRSVVFLVDLVLPLLSKPVVEVAERRIHIACLLRLNASDFLIGGRIFASPLSESLLDPLQLVLVLSHPVGSRHVVSGFYLAHVWVGVVGVVC